MIIATAGHVDHGKTLLVKALTGIDADRLPEEKARGLTIDLGFAYWPVAGGPTVGFVDVPGHERFVRNMLCGVAGIDFVLFVVAADDGPKPQTAEHLAILDLLGVSEGAVALTKTDRAGASRVAEVEAEIRTLLAGTALADIPVFPVSAVTGAGVDALKDHLAGVARAWRPREVAGNFRLSVDRCFTVVGAGLVVTGTAVSGQVAASDSVCPVLAGLDLRVRGIHAQNASAAEGRAGQRLALNLAGPGLDKDRIVRGDWIVSGTPAPPVHKIDARLKLLPSEARAVAHWTPVHVHLGAAEATGRVALLDGTPIAPGGSGRVQLVLGRPIVALAGDRFIVRDTSARRTIGGGHVIDIFAPARGRARPERLAVLDALETPDHGKALTDLLAQAANGVDLARFALARNLTPDEAAQLYANASMKRVTSGAVDLGFAPDHWDRLRNVALAALAAWHKRSPDTVGPAEDRILQGTGVRLAHEAVVAIAGELIREGAIVREGMGVRLATHRPQLDPADAALWAKIAPLLEAQPLRPPGVHEIATTLNADPRRTESMLVRAARHGLVVRVSKTRFYLPAGLRALADIAVEVAAVRPDRLVTAAGFRDASGIGRNVSIEILEFFDKVKFTRRKGDAHEVLRRPTEAFGGTTAAAALDSPPRPAGKESRPGGPHGLQSR